MATMVDKEQRSDTASVENEMKPRWNMTTSQSRRFIMYWASNNCEMQLYATELYAKKSHGNGMAIFALPLENWKRLLEDENASIAIYTMLQTLLRNDEAVTAAGIPNRLSIFALSTTARYPSQKPTNIDRNMA